MARIFICYKSEDRLAAVAFRRWLAGQGWGEEDVFLDLYGIGAGARWKDALKAANARCEAVVFLASPEALASHECRTELRMAEDYGKPIITAIIRDLSPGDERLADFRDRQIVDLTSEPTEDIQIDGDAARPVVRLSGDALQKIQAQLVETGIAPQSYPWPPDDRPDAPIFPGLASFDERDAAIYFGRDADIVRGLDGLRRLRRQARPRVIAIQAASGAGKSSFLKAGLWPRLKRDPDFAPLAILRPAGGIMRGEFGIGRGLARWFRDRNEQRNPGDLAAAAAESQERFAAFFAEVTTHAWRARQTARPDAPAPAVVIGVDQAEELFAKADAAESGLFLDRLAGLMAAPPEHVQPLVLLTIRADSLDPLLAAMAVRGMEQAELLALPPMPAAAHRAVIEGPVAVANRTGRRLAIDPDLVEALTRDARGADALPLLAFTLQRLDSDYGADGRLELAEYDKLGGVDGSRRCALCRRRRRRRYGAAQLGHSVSGDLGPGRGRTQAAACVRGPASGGGQGPAPTASWRACGGAAAST
jgi:hypothetical protein